MKMFNIANVIFWPAYLLPTAFCNDLKRNPCPDMRRGTHEDIPQSDRNNTSLRELFVEDKDIILMVLPGFFYYCHTTEADTSRTPVEGELSRGLRAMFETKEVILPLAFATTLFLDIQHILEDKADEGFKQMSEATHFVQANIEEDLNFHEGIELATWRKENDMAVQQFADILQFCIKDKCRHDFIRLFGPGYITKESELPFVVGYVLMSAASTQEVGNLLKARLPGVLPTNKVLDDAIDVVMEMIRKEAGALIVNHVLPKGLGLHINIEYNPEE